MSRTADRKLSRPDARLMGRSSGRLALGGRRGGEGRSALAHRSLSGFIARPQGRVSVGRASRIMQRQARPKSIAPRRAAHGPFVGALGFGRTKGRRGEEQPCAPQPVRVHRAPEKARKRLSLIQNHAEKVAPQKHRAPTRGFFAACRGAMRMLTLWGASSCLRARGRVWAWRTCR